MEHTMIFSIKRRLGAFTLLGITLCSLASCGKDNARTIGIAWRADLDSEFYTNMVRAIEDAGAKPVLLSQSVSEDLSYDGNKKLQSSCVDSNGILKVEYAAKIRANSYTHSNAKTVVGSLDTVIFTGGEDISPSLFATPEEWHGIEAEKDYNATRDVSDYLTMSYCVANDIKLMGFCRGMQMLGGFLGRHGYARYSHLF
jgi:putative glutamine amidotransferase